MPGSGERRSVGARVCVLLSCPGGLMPFLNIKYPLPITTENWICVHVAFLSGNELGMFLNYWHEVMYMKYQKQWIQLGSKKGITDWYQHETSLGAHLYKHVTNHEDQFRNSPVNKMPLCLESYIKLLLLSTEHFSCGDFRRARIYFPLGTNIRRAHEAEMRNNFSLLIKWPPLCSSGQSSWLQIRRPGFDSLHYQKKK
jgi:hypothetical protein